MQAVVGVHSVSNYNFGTKDTRSNKALPTPDERAAHLQQECVACLPGSACRSARHSPAPCAQVCCCGHAAHGGGCAAGTRAPPPQRAAAADRRQLLQAARRPPAPAGGGCARALPLRAASCKRQQAVLSHGTAPPQLFSKRPCNASARPHFRQLRHSRRVRPAGRPLKPRAGAQRWQA